MRRGTSIIGTGKYVGHSRFHVVLLTPVLLTPVLLTPVPQPQ